MKSVSNAQNMVENVNNKLPSMAERYTLFVSHYCNKANQKTYHNATQSALSVGYSKTSAARSGCDLLKRAHVQKLIEQIEEPLNELSNINDDIASEVKRFEDINKQRLVLMAFTDLVGLKANAANKPRYYEFIAKSLGMFESSVNVTTVCGISITSDANDIAVKFAQTIAKSNPTKHFTKEMSSEKVTT